MIRPKRIFSPLAISRAGLIAGLYVALTALSAAFGLSSGAVQFRLSEALCILPVFVPEAVYGLAIGCLLSNLITGCAVWDIVFGTLATLLGAIGTRLLKKHIVPAAMAPVAANTVIVPILLIVVYRLEQAWWLCVLGVFAGEAVCAGIGGLLLGKALMPLKDRLFRQNEK